jgi:hypothetical protein
MAPEKSRKWKIKAIMDDNDWDILSLFLRQKMKSNFTKF